MFRVIQAAYEALRNTENRKRYDEKLATKAKKGESSKQSSSEYKQKKPQSSSNEHQKPKWKSDASNQSKKSTVKSLRGWGHSATIAVMGFFVIGILYLLMLNFDPRQTELAVSSAKPFVNPSTIVDHNDLNSQPRIRQSVANGKSSLDTSQVIVEKPVVQSESKADFVQRLLAEPSVTQKLNNGGLTDIGKLDAAQPPQSPQTINPRAGLKLKTDKHLPISSLELADGRALLLINQTIIFLRVLTDSQMQQNMEMVTAKNILQAALESRSEINITHATLKLRDAMARSAAYGAYSAGKLEKIGAIEPKNENVGSWDASNKIKDRRVGGREILEGQVITVEP